MSDYDDGFYIDGEGFDGSGDDDSVEAYEYQMRQQGLDPDLFEDDGKDCILLTKQAG